LGGDNRFREKTGNDFDDRANFEPVKGKYTMVELDYGANDDDDVRAATDLISLTCGLTLNVKHTCRACGVVWCVMCVSCGGWSLRVAWRAAGRRR
jgi:hypothetical protein